MPELKKGDTYCTMWTTHLEGPFIYDGKANLLFNTVIKAPSSVLIPAQFGFDIMRDTHTMENGGLKIPFEELANPEWIDVEINAMEARIHKLRCLKELSPQIKKALTGE